jgi:hypothetical protein
MQKLTRLVGGNGLKTNEQWEAMSHLERVAWVDGLDLVHVRAQASVRASASRRTVAQILDAWRLHGYLSDERATAALAAEVTA